MVDQITPTSGPLGSGFNIDNFISITATGFARPNRFLLRLYNLPASFSGFSNLTTLQQAANNIEFYCEGAALPGVSTATHTSIRYGYGTAQKNPMLPIFNDINLSVLADDAGNNSYFWRSWVQSIANFNMGGGISPTAGPTPFELAYRSEFTCDIQITRFDMTGVAAEVIRLREAFPVFVGDSQINWGDNNNVMRIPVSINYVDWYYDVDAMRSGV